MRGARRSRALLLVAGVCSATLVAHAQTGPTSQAPVSPNARVGRGERAIPQVRWAKGIAADASRVWIAGGNEGLILLTRGAPPRRVVGPGSVVAIGLGRTGAVVVAGYDGRLHRIEGDRWTRGPEVQPAGSRDRVVGIAVADDGAAFVATETTGLVSWSSRGVSAVPYGVAGARAHALVLASDGTAYVTGRERLFLEIRGGRVQAPPFAAAAMQALEAEHEELGAMWISPSTGRLWIGTNGRRLLEVDRARGAVTVHSMPSFGMVRAIVGYGTGADETLVVAAQSEIAVRRDGRFAQLPGTYSFAEGLVVEPGTDTLWVANRDGVHRIALRERRVIPSSPVPVTAEMPTVSVPDPAAATGPGPAPSATDPPPTAPPTDPPDARRSGPRLQVVRMSGCGLLGALALTAQVQRAASCVRSGQSVEVDVEIRGGRAARLDVSGPRASASCVRARLRRLRVPADRCEATVRVEQP
ncbi:MAG: hypothetical protein IT379_34985 [Deltaproteobacteria bacterium]|nr:hypothetical protein [Deltaproteobacteria bacterium]